MIESGFVMKATDVKRFSQTLLKQKLGAEYRVITKRDLVRMRGPFAQAVLLAIKRSGWLHIIPTFYVVGADPAHEVMFQTMSLPMTGIDSDRQWNVPPEAALDEALAERFIRQIERDSPLSFRQPLADSGIHQTLVKFCKYGKHWMPSLSLAYWEMLTGSASAANTLAMAKKEFVKYSRFGSGKEPLDFERALMARYELLQARLGSPDGISQCRAEAEAHAAKLKLPKIEWPPEWPTA